jgi:hypothetical protein
VRARSALSPQKINNTHSRTQAISLSLMALVARTRRRGCIIICLRGGRKKPFIISRMIETPRTTKRVCANDHLLKCVFHQVDLPFCCEWGCALPQLRTTRPTSARPKYISRSRGASGITQQSNSGYQSTQQPKKLHNGFPQVHRECSL